ncbi:glucan ABC transporter ATP-binding protein/ permease [Limoniibacter endophyticus]|uniref:Beta-(1-->2)glucan export ATP-binding/permease protein NdvA n=1 Tax=Limoniibacter endophyticus TaxID=1565040 RepID=A0A8J3DNT7_9HYPH|nr:glucan ABC transporter ATP-binding protein/ permease [Limoniibacter endophyticus]GHC75010.1 beta-(1-->2)glucan export ATP-binding/permease protein NdvA [Limoniibacter endophyticus]
MTLVEIYKRAIGYLAPRKGRVAVICAFNVALAIVVIAEPILFGRVIDTISGGMDVVPTLMIWAALGAFNIVASVLVARGADRLAHERRASVLTESYERVVSMPLSWHQQNGTSYSLQTLLRAVDALQGLWLDFMRTHLSTIVALALLIPTALAMDLRMSAVLFVLGVSYVLISRLVMKKTKDGQMSVENHNHKMFSHVSDSITNVSVLQSYNRVQQETSALRDYAENLLKAQYPVLDWWAVANAMHRLASTVAMMVVLIIGAILVSAGEMRIGDVVAFTGFAQLLIGRLEQISTFVNQIFESRARLEQFYVMEDAASQSKEPETARDLGKVEGHLRFENVEFFFPNGTKGASDVSFEILPGETLAIVGPTGSGKTTLINLLQRVYDPSEGAIYIDGVDTRSVSKNSLRANIASVFQDAGLLNRSIEENIRVGREGATNAEVEAAAEAASCDFILSKSEGYDTLVGDRGGKLSGGERQRIAIARAVLKNAPILVLDEATSALDVETEERVKSAIDNLRENRTTIIIAHRLSTVRDADKVLFLDGGRIIEMGTFDELAKQGGRFTSLLKAGGLAMDDDLTPRVLQKAA